MKKLLLFLSFLLFTHINSVKADDWNCMSKDQAESLVEYLSENPFVINFCDCCYDITGEDEEKPMGHLIKIENMDKLFLLYFYIFLNNSSSFFDYIFKF